MNFISGTVPIHEALRQATTTRHNPDTLRVAQRASDAFLELLAGVGPELLAWAFMQANGAAAPSPQEQRAGLEMFATSIEEARDAARAIAQ